MTKRLLDFSIAFLALIVLGCLIILFLIVSMIDTKSMGLFYQKRVGRHEKNFTIFKIKTLNHLTKQPTIFGKFLRKYKLDELPQLINILNGTMSFVGPRPDISGYADKLMGDDRVILNVRPGVTGLASIKYRNEEYLLAQHSNPLAYNDNIIWPDKVRINKWYAENHTFLIDVKILWYTIIPVSLDIEQFMVKNSKF
jgi:lipopolysaccharide/colanic/teichoic acid biosynthesis glycosyltransferase